MSREGVILASLSLLGVDFLPFLSLPDPLVTLSGAHPLPWLRGPPHPTSFPQRNCRSSENPNEVFRFLVEEKIKCLATEKVKYTQRVDYIMQLPVPMDAALNKGRLLSAEPGGSGTVRPGRSIWPPCGRRAHGMPCSPSQRSGAGR